MARFALRRLLGLVPTLLTIVVLSFAVIRLAPGSPFSSEKAIPYEVRQALEAKYGFDQPLPVQLGRYVWGLMRGDLGLSTKYPQRTVNEIIAEACPSPCSWAASRSPGRCSWVSAPASSAPCGKTVFGTMPPWRRRCSASASRRSSSGRCSFGFLLDPLLAPTRRLGQLAARRLARLTLGTVYAAYVARLTRGGMLEVVSRRLRAHGARQGPASACIVRRHMLKGGILPVVTSWGRRSPACWWAAS